MIFKELYTVLFIYNCKEHKYILQLVILCQEKLKTFKSVPDAFNTLQAYINRHKQVHKKALINTQYF